MDTFIVLLIGLLFCAAVALGLYSLTRLKEEVPDEDREYMDPLPPLLRLVWPLVRFLDYHVCAFIPTSALERTHERLQRTGVGYLMTAEQFFAIRILSVVALFALAIYANAMLARDSTETVLGAVVLGFFLPRIWLSDVQQRRVKAIQRTLPVYLDFVTMAVEAGLNMTGAINQAMEKGPSGPLRHEFFLVVRDLRSGLSRSEALRRMDARLGMSEITSFVGTVIQAEKMGARLGSALRAQSEQRRTERFQRAEKLAMEAPVKLIGPLMMFIFPVTFIVLGFPIAMKFLNSGML
ncbi:MAG TPA: type II secretion system F family protein [Rhodocyclaceae bacterium]|jgi:tight adherence protein C|nr:type II secretion system F family protein [Rhodocyclaceae bacterium]